MNCVNSVKLRLQSLRDGKCPFDFDAKEMYSESGFFSHNFCLLAFQVVYPYYLTLTSGGWFSWVRPGDGVIVRCPNPGGALEMKIFLCDSKKDVRVEILQAKGHCPKGHKRGDVFILGQETFKFCPKALSAFIPYIELVAKGGQLPWKNKDKKTILRCPHTACACFEVIAERA